MIKYEILNKEQFGLYSNKIFDILSTNMKNIAHTDDSDEQDFIIWNDYISEAIKTKSQTSFHFKGEFAGFINRNDLKNREQISI